MVTELNQENFKQMTKQGKAIVDFYADWCGPCQMMKPTFEKVAASMKGINFFKINVDNAPDTAQMYAVRSIPTIVFLKDGKEMDRILGVLQEQDFKAKISSVLK
jgi:thioredoxin 1